MKQKEQELKILLTKRQYEMLTDGFPAVLQENFYFSTKAPDKNVMVRIRQKKCRFNLTVKRRQEEKDGIWVCDEFDCEIDQNQAQIYIDKGIAQRRVNELFGIDIGGDYHFVGLLTTHRTKRQFQEYVLEIDKNEYFDVCDYELECEHQNKEKLQQLKDLLKQNYDVDFCPSKAKSQRFFEKLNENVTQN